MTVSVSVCGAEFMVTGTYYQGHPGTMYQSNGDPGDPPEDADFEITEVQAGGESLLEFLTDEQYEIIKNAVLEQIGEDDGPDPMDYLRDMRMEAQI